jgi:hypothetical protein
VSEWTHFLSHFLTTIVQIIRDIIYPNLEIYFISGHATPNGSYLTCSSLPPPHHWVTPFPSLPLFHIQLPTFYFPHSLHRLTQIFLKTSTPLPLLKSFRLRPLLARSISLDSILKLHKKYLILASSSPSDMASQICCKLAAWTDIEKRYCLNIVE